MRTIQRAYAKVLAAVVAAARRVYGARLVSAVLFGSVARGTPRFDSDIDLLLVVEGLPRSRMARVREFEAVETLVEPALAAARTAGVHTFLSPVLKTPGEVEAGSPLFLDFVEDARILYDRGDFFATFLRSFRARLAGLGARRVRRGGSWYWVVKEAYRPGEVFEL